MWIEIIILQNIRMCKGLFLVHYLTVKMHKITRYFLVVIYERKWLTLTENGDILDLKMNEKENKWLKMIKYQKVQSK